jgi:Mg2+ and Co2+ transporter CorA
MTFGQVLELLSRIISIIIGSSAVLALILKKPREWIGNYVKKISITCMTENLQPIAAQIESQSDMIQKISESVDKIEQQNAAQSKQIELITTTQSEMFKQIKISEQTSLDLLRYNFNRVYYIAKRDGVISAHDKENCCNMYKNYKDLHGNSYIDELYKELMALPVK